MAGCGADTEANDLIISLTDGKNFDIETPDISGPEYQLPATTGDLFTPFDKLTNEDLTTRQVNGEGTFDALMAGFSAHLAREFEKGRITGSEFTQAYIQMSQAAMGNATQFLLARDGSYWQAVAGQIAAQTAQINLVSARVELAASKAKLATIQLEALNAEANYALTKLKLATESEQYCAAKYNVENILPLQKAQLEKQNLVLQGEVDMIPLKKETMEEQLETIRAQTLDARKDGTLIAGSVGMQKALYNQQITSYKRDAETKAAKIFSDAWITMKTIDEGLTPPTAFTNANLDVILASVKANNNL